MNFEEALIQVRELLEREGRVAYRILKRRFALTDDDVEDLKADLIDAKRLAIDEDGKVLVWAGKGINGEKDKRGKGEDCLESSVQSPNKAKGKRQKSKGKSENSKENRKAKNSELGTQNSELTVGERRQLTVMFCDVVGSTALSAQLDPEDLREVIQAYQETCAQVIKRFDGHIAQYLGDGLLVYFGYPTAHEDDAARAVRAGMGIVKAIREHVTGNGGQVRRQPLQVRIGIHTGLVVISEIGSREKHENLALGETPNITARVQSKAAPNTVVISPATHQLVQGLFDCDDLGSHEMHGVLTPLRLYQVIREGTAQSRFDVAVSHGLTPLVGRDHEVGLLTERWERSKPKAKSSSSVVNQGLASRGSYK
jgi:class 3 adenylate cyclase